MIELGRTEKVIREMDKLANEDHTHIVYRRRTRRITWLLVDTFELYVGSDTMPVRHRPDFQRSALSFASSQESGGSSLLPKLVAKLFLIVVAMSKTSW